MTLRIYTVGALIALCSVLDLSVCKIETYQQIALEEHNRYRAIHHAEPLVLNETLNDIAVRCATWYLVNRKKAHQCPYKKDALQYIGENGSAMWGGVPHDYERFAKSSASMWYEEVFKEGYNYSKTLNHFSQLVWRGSKQLGYGIASEGKLIHGWAMYWPGGNVVNRFKIAHNVKRPEYITGDESDLTEFNVTYMPVALKKYQQIAVNLHNDYRAKHHCEPLVLNETLNDIAQRCAWWYCHKQRDGKCPYKAEAVTQLSENIWDWWTGGNDYYDHEKWSKRAVESWYNDINKQGHNYSQLNQLVSRDTKQLGFGVLNNYNGNGRTICALALYSPPGNVDDQSFLKNVTRPEYQLGDNSDSIERNTTAYILRQSRLAAVIALNEYRAKHHSGPLALNDTLSDIAQRCAVLYCHHKRHGKCPYKAEAITEVSESMWDKWVGSPNHDFEQRSRNAVDDWYNQVNRKDFNYTIFNDFTRLVWKDSTQLGFGITNSYNHSGKTACAVALYYPPGNINEETFWKNVKRPEYQPGDYSDTTVFNTSVYTTEMVRVYQQIALDLHNEYRTKHHSDPLVLNETLSEIAQRCAVLYAHNKRDGKCPYKAEALTDLSESSWQLWHGKKYDFKKRSRIAVEDWYNSVNEPGYDYTTLNDFTRLVWKGSKQLGFGIGNSYNNSGKMTVAVALYSPPGNVDKESIHKNVMRP